MAAIFTEVTTFFKIAIKLGFICVSVFACQAREPVLSALGGCKILRELSKLEKEVEEKVAMKELAKTFEKLAHGESLHMLHCSLHVCTHSCTLCSSNQALWVVDKQT